MLVVGKEGKIINAPEGWNQEVRKANDLIQKSRFSLSLNQQKIVLYLISMINPTDDDFKEYSLSVIEFCRLLGIDYKSGNKYSEIKAAIKSIADKSMWIELPNGKSTLVRWIEKAIIDNNSGRIIIRLDSDLRPYLLQLRSNYTQYELIYTLHFKSKYTIRFYELVKSIHYDKSKPYTRDYTVEELRQHIGAEIYTQYKDLKRRVLLPTVKEINGYSDIRIELQEIKTGNKVTSIRIKIEPKSADEIMSTLSVVERNLWSNQLTVWSIAEIGAESHEQEESTSE